MKRAASVFAWIVMGAAAVALWSDGAVVGRNVIAIALQIVAAGVMIWARVTFGRRSFHAAANPTDGGLVTHGPYRFVRNPIYSSAILFFVAGLIEHFSMKHLALDAILIAGALTRCFLEEQALRAHYAAEYHAYAQRTARLVPFLL